MAKSKAKKENLTKSTVKNSIYNFTYTFISKIGALILTIILARMLLPELFGIYGLVMSIFLIATTFTDLGASNTLIRYASKSLASNNKKEAKSYIRYLFKIKLLLTIGVILIILTISKYLAYNIYN